MKYQSWGEGGGGGGVLAKKEFLTIIFLNFF